MSLKKILKNKFFTRLFAAIMIFNITVCTAFSNIVSAETASDRNAAIEAAIDKAHEEYDDAFTVVESSAFIFEENDSCYLIYIELKNASYVAVYVVQKGINKVVYSAGAQDYWEGILDEIYMSRVTLEEISSEPPEMSLSNEVLDVIGKNAAYIINKYGTPTQFDSGEDDFMGRQLYYTDGLDFDMARGTDSVQYVWGTAAELIDGFDNNSYSADEMAAALSTDGSYSYNELVSYGDYTFPYSNISMNTLYGTIQIECDNLTVFKTSAARLIIDGKYFQTEPEAETLGGYYDVIAEICGGSPKAYPDEELSLDEIKKRNSMYLDEYVDGYEGIYYLKLFDMDNDGVNELFFTYAKGMYSVAASCLIPVGVDYIYTMENGVPKRIYCSEEGTFMGGSSSESWGVSAINGNNYLIKTHTGVEGGYIIYYYVYCKKGSSIEFVATFRSISLKIGEKSFYITQNNTEKSVSENEFTEEASKYMTLSGSLGTGASYESLPVFKPYESISKASDISITETLKDDSSQISSSSSNGGISVLINGSDMIFDVEPYIENGVTMVPMRAIFEALGAQITYDSETKTVSAVKNNITVILTVGSSTASINGENANLQNPADVINGTTMVPLRFVAEALDAEVNWNGDTKTVTILG